MYPVGSNASCGRCRTDSVLCTIFTCTLLFSLLCFHPSQLCDPFTGTETESLATRGWGASLLRPLAMFRLLVKRARCHSTQVLRRITVSDAHTSGLQGAALERMSMRTPLLLSSSGVKRRIRKQPMPQTFCFSLWKPNLYSNTNHRHLAPHILDQYRLRILEKWASNQSRSTWKSSATYFSLIPWTPVLWTLNHRTCM